VQLPMTITQQDANQGDDIIAHDLNGDQAEHEGTKPKTRVLKSPALGKEIERIHLQGSKNRADKTDQQKQDAKSF